MEKNLLVGHLRAFGIRASSSNPLCRIRCSPGGFRRVDWFNHYSCASAIWSHLSSHARDPGVALNIITPYPFSGRAESKLGQHPVVSAASMSRVQNNVKLSKTLESVSARRSPERGVWGFA